MNRADLVQHLRSHGCRFLREGNRHAIWENTATGQRAPMPRRREINNVMAAIICRQLGVPSP